jgi:hypothetical protein
MHVTPEVAAGLYGEVRTLVDDARMARKERVVRLWQVVPAPRKLRWNVCGRSSTSKHRVTSRVPLRCQPGRG